MTAIRIVLQVLLVLTSLFLTILILLHKGRGGGLSDMFGGGATSSMGSSGVAERNLNRFTVAVALVWTAAIVLLGVLERFPERVLSARPAGRPRPPSRTDSRTDQPHCTAHP